MTTETKKGMTIYKKLIAFQKLNISILKDGKNPHFKSSYSTLNEVLDKVKKPLNDLGILILFTPEADGLRTTLYDIETDQKIESFMKYVGVANAQGILSCNTYFRRGSLVALLGLESEDDDGTEASKPQIVKKIVMEKDSEIFLQAKNFVSTGGLIEDIEKKYILSKEIIKLLTGQK